MLEPPFQSYTAKESYHYAVYHKIHRFRCVQRKISVAIADEGQAKPRYYGSIAHTPAALRKLIKELGPAHTLSFCYEAGPTGYETHRWIESMGAHSVVIAPSLIPKRAGDRVKTDRRDAEQLARLFRAGELTPIYVPAPEDEALRELVRARETAREDVHRARQRVLKFYYATRFIRQSTSNVVGRRNIGRGWAHSFPQASMQTAFTEYLHTLNEIEQRIGRLEHALMEEAATHPKAEMIRILQSLRGIGFLTAVSLVSEIGSFARFSSPAKLMAYLGLVPVSIHLEPAPNGISDQNGEWTPASNAD